MEQGQGRWEGLSEVLARIMAGVRVKGRDMGRTADELWGSG